MVESTESIRRILTVEVLRGAITITMLAARFTEIELTEGLAFAAQMFSEAEYTLPKTPEDGRNGS